MLDEPEIRRRVAAARVARLATVDAAGRPHLVPICFVLDGDVVYSAVDHKPKRSTKLQRLANVRANPAAAVLVDAYDEDWDTLWWIRLDGDARVIEDGAERERPFELLSAKYPQYRAQRPHGAVLAVSIRAWRSWAAAGTAG